MEPEGDNRLLQDVLTRADNETCADCGNPEPDWASLTLGVFVCQACSLLHRSIPHISRVKSVQDTWDASDVELMAAMGNNVAKAKYEQKVPAFYYRPKHTDCKLLREQWIRAKYERNEFEFIEKQEPYSAGYREGFLWKRGRDNGQFLSRKFILSEREGALKYFNKHDVSTIRLVVINTCMFCSNTFYSVVLSMLPPFKARDPKAVMKIETLNATFQPAKIGNPCGLQITYLKDNSTRNIFVYHSDAKEMVDWFNAIRAARFHYLQVAYPGASDEELVPKLTRNFMREGFMEKTGPKHTEGFKKRWFTMDDRRLMYFKDPLDAYARGEVFIGSKENSYTVLPGLPPTIQGYHWNHGITIVTPDRKFLFACETEAEQRDWIAAFQRVINRPMRPQEYAVEAHFKHKP
ncbi:arf-GAP with dual PH domain-containing protein 1-like isoform X1 [Nerophis lumbriciformis]|uniref:arf-GAP with dual PH domain-containing protein 1-like isoform X1 n=1 Tax=Nerophis lumbriciformis TaxID=546530 RepID=UPI002ADF6D2F|nr:arf-GAP with dual PH domain-containing protein 1-like isoform X1 [Nerophis lumbriciformis]